MVCTSFKDHTGRVWGHNKTIFWRIIHKGNRLIIVLTKLYYIIIMLESWVLAVVTETRAKTRWLAGF